MPDGTVIWTLPKERTYVTLPGSALLFPGLMVPTGELSDPPEHEPEGDRTARIPRRKTSRARNRADRIAAERSSNRRQRLGAPF